MVPSACDAYGSEELEEVLAPDARRRPRLSAGARLVQARTASVGVCSRANARRPEDRSRTGSHAITRLRCGRTESRSTKPRSLAPRSSTGGVSQSSSWPCSEAAFRKVFLARPRSMRRPGRSSGILTRLESSGERAYAIPAKVARLRWPALPANGANRGSPVRRTHSGARCCGAIGMEGFRLGAAELPRRDFRGR